jgi:hypothetical protein
VVHPEKARDVLIPLARIDLLSGMRKLGWVEPSYRP